MPVNERVHLPARCSCLYPAPLRDLTASCKNIHRKWIDALLRTNLRTRMTGICCQQPLSAAVIVTPNIKDFPDHALVATTVQLRQFSELL